MNPYQVEYRPEVHDDLEQFPANIQARLKKAIEQRLTSFPNRYGERLRHSLIGLWKLRVGDYRIIYEIQRTNVVIWMIAHRREIYGDIERRWAK